MARRVLRYFVLTIMAAAVILPQTLVATAQETIPPIMPLAELKPGMRGVGRTVVKGQKPEEFNFEIVSILQGGGGIINVKHLILFRMFGPLAERTGGSAAGMSGSPLYVNGKMIGALSASYVGTRPGQNLALGTPIEDMLPLLQTSGSTDPWPTAFRPLGRPPIVGGVPINDVIVSFSRTDAQRADRLPGTMAFMPATTITRVSGLSPRAFSLLKRALGDRYPRPLQQGVGGRMKIKAEPIRAGSSVGVVQVMGDVEFGGICTTTLRVGNKALICGHPWDQFGRVAYGLTTSEVVLVIRGTERNFKEFNLGDLVGQIDLDRGSAIRGVIGQLPRMFAVRITVVDADSGTRVTKGALVVRRPDLVKLFVPFTALSAVDSARDQTFGEGTARVKMVVRASGLPVPLERENVFYSSRDVASASMLDLPLVMQFLFYNPFASLDPIDITMEVTLSSKRETAVITNVVAERREVSPGETIRVRMTIRPHQLDSLTSRVIDVPVPRNFPRGPATLVVGSGGIDPTGAPVEDLLISQVVSELPPFPGDNLEEAAEIFENLGKNNHILLQLVPFGLPTEGSEFTKFDVFAGRLLQTDWVIQGEFSVPILVR